MTRREFLGLLARVGACLVVGPAITACDKLIRPSGTGIVASQEPVDDLTKTPLKEDTSTPQATEEPTKTNTSEPTKEPTATPEAGYDFELMQKHPKSYADFLANPTGYFEAPNPVEYPKKWKEFIDKYGEYKGPRDQRKVNIDSMGGGFTIFSDMTVDISSGSATEVRSSVGEYDFFVLEFNGVFYPCYALTVGIKGAPVGTIIAVLQDTPPANPRSENFGTEAMGPLSEGNFHFQQLDILGKQTTNFTEDMVNLMAAGLNARKVGDHIYPGFAQIQHR